MFNSIRLFDHSGASPDERVNLLEQSLAEVEEEKDALERQRNKLKRQVEEAESGWSLAPEEEAWQEVPLL